MKKLIVIFTFFFISIANTFAQDIITLKNGTDIQALVQEVCEGDVKYKRFDNPNGPNYTMKKSEIFMIRYKNGTKDLFSEQAKPLDTKEVAKSRSESLNDNEKTETVNLPENMQSRKDVIVLDDDYIGFQTEIIRSDDKYVYYKKYKSNGKEITKKIRKRKIAFTLSFNEKFKQGTYPLQMTVDDFMGLPIYCSKKDRSWIVFGTNRTIVLSELEKREPTMYKSYITGKALSPVMFGVQIVGHTMLNSAFENYYATFVNSEICSKYGIVITPYKESLARP